MEILTKSERETKKIGQILAKEVLKTNFKKPFVLALKGKLGGGKTTFLKGFARGLGIKEKILSPTFILIRKFNIKHRTSNFEHFYHIDCYRIENPKEILDLGFKEIILNPKNIVAIEWANKIKKILPKEVVWLDFKIKGKNEREIKIKWRNF
jgi:tRNA threonylcarbamoyladenosine biosynthesis protein TsaE